MTDLLTELEALVEKWTHWLTFEGDLGRTDTEAMHQTYAMCIQQLDSLIAAEKARGPDPLLVQAREALERYDKMIAIIHYTHPHLGWSAEDGEFIKATFAALDARLGGRP